MKLLKALIFIFSVMLFLFNGCDDSNKKKATYFWDVDTSSLPFLQFDGLYQSEPVKDGDSQMWHYVHFYEDGTVITVWTPGTPAEIISWFNKGNIENGNFGHGQYEIEDSQLIFTSTYSNGTVDYDGSFQDDVLTLNSYSNINDTFDTRTYTFVEIAEE